MKKLNLIIGACVLAVAPLVQSCDTDSDDNRYLMLPTALVTVCPQPDESVILQLTDEDQLIPVNLSKSPFGKKEVRALVNYTPVNETSKASITEVRVHWIDSICTKLPVLFDEADENKYGNDPLEIIRDWVTVAEDGYLTLRIRTEWGANRRPHRLTLTYTDDESVEVPEFTLHQNSNGDMGGNMGDALIAFNLNKLLDGTERPYKIKLKWRSFTGDKTAEFTFNSNRLPVENSPRPEVSVNMVE